MAKKNRSNVLDYLAYVIVRLFVCVMQACSYDAGCQFARFLAWLMYLVDKRHRAVAVENLRRAFPGRYTDAEIDVLVRGVYFHICMILIEMLHMPRRLHLHNFRKHVELEGLADVVEVLLTGRPVLFVTGHFGNWETAGFAFALIGVHLHAIARPLDNPYLDDFLRSYRESTGQKLLAKHGDFDRMEKVLSEGGAIATLADQDAGQRGLFVDFFGHPASTHKAVALMALEHRVPMLVIGMPRIGGRYHLLAADAIFPEDYEKDPDAVRAITQRFTSGLEKLVRMAPEQYFWVHRRWKHAPPVRKKKAAAA